MPMPINSYLSPYTPYSPFTVFSSLKNNLNPQWTRPDEFLSDQTLVLFVFLKKKKEKKSACLIPLTDGKVPARSGIDQVYSTACMYTARPAGIQHGLPITGAQRVTRVTRYTARPADYRSTKGNQGNQVYSTACRLQEHSG